MLSTEKCGIFWGFLLMSWLPSLSLLQLYSCSNGRTIPYIAQITKKTMDLPGGGPLLAWKPKSPRYSTVICMSQSIRNSLLSWPNEMEALHYEAYHGYMTTPCSRIPFLDLVYDHKTLLHLCSSRRSLGCLLTLIRICMPKFVGIGTHFRSLLHCDFETSCILNLQMKLAIFFLFCYP